MTPEETRASPKKQSDPLLKNAAVMRYREVVHFWPNHIQREMIAENVDPDSEREMRIWTAVLIEFMEQGRNPKDAKAMIKIFRNMVFDIGHGREGVDR